jgi:hypothetical protein
VTERIPLQTIIEELADDGSFICSPAVFAVINRTLNEHGYQANVMGSIGPATSFDGDICRFRIEKAP